MSFQGMGKSIVRWDFLPGAGGEVVFCSPDTHRRDESAAGYSSVGCTPALPASASPAGFILKHLVATVNSYSRWGGFFDRNNAESQPALTRRRIQILARNVRNISVTFLIEAT
jgi:hypothetical protein